MDLEVDKAVQILGGQRAAAEKLGVTDSAISRWVKSGCIPPSRVWEVYLAVGDQKASSAFFSIENALRQAYEKCKKT
ncbi:Cro/CI family transcriptional regulator [Agarilytica rhodophyticola]|uniref:Cro/CI family transcriptional regulator n=1 Tax=Agarilytica rhodophyticola TaxID=1737490 RepID=UPI00131559A8|nr:Cro/CI family transcriptional regulator [Agarilytica rhodophyticola]